MLAVVINRFGMPHEGGLQIVERERPQPGADEVLVEVHAAGLNPSDLGNVMGRFAQTHLPRIPGRDFAGVVVEGPSSLLGQGVWGGGAELGFTRDGTHAQYVVVPSAGISPKPTALTMEQAGAVGVPFLTAWLGIQAAQVQAGDTLLVIGSRGAVGSAAIQIGLMRGIRVIGAERSNETTGGAAYDVVRSDRPEDMPSAVYDLTDARGADGCLDTVGGPLSSLTPGGRLATITAKGDGKVQFDLRDFYHRELHLIGVDSLHATLAEASRILTELRQGFDTGALTAPQVQSVSLSSAVDAYQALLASQQAGTSMPKTALIPW
jgi:NADPH:quinone reductase